MSQLIAPYISLKEYACPCCGQLPPDMRERDGELSGTYLLFFDAFRAIRELWGKPINITSGYRCPDKNAEVGGEPLSVHLFGLALDLDCKDAGEVKALADTIELINPELRRGEYTKTASFVHIDAGYLIFPRATDAWQEGVRWKK